MPVSIFESVIDLVNGEATMLFVPLTYTLATEEAERIGVDHVARMCTNDQGESSLGKKSFKLILINKSVIVPYILILTVLKMNFKILLEVCLKFYWNHV